MIKRILLGLGGTPFTSAAIRHAVELAKVHDAELTGVTVIDIDRLTHIGPTPIGAGGAAEELREHRIHVSEERIEKAIAKFESACKEDGVRYVIDREKGDEFDLMAALSRYHDLMIFGLRSLFDCGLGVDPPDALARLIGEGVRPILAVSNVFRPIRRVLMAYSGSPESAKTIKWFNQLRLWPDIELRIITCEHPEDKSLQLLADMATYCRSHGMDPETADFGESAHHQILADADQWDADLIVMGNSVRSYLQRKIFGETALHVMQHANRPLFLSH